MKNIEKEYKDWLKTEIYPNLGLGFHPDENFEDYINLETNEPTFTKKECDKLNYKMKYFFDKLGDDVYDIGFDELKKFHPELGIGSDVQESNIMSFSQFVNEQLSFDKKINENFEVIYTEHNCRGSKKFKKQSDALKFTKDFIQNKDDKKLSEIALYRGTVTDTSDVSKVIVWWDKGNNYMSNMSKKDPNLASKKINENRIFEAKKNFVRLPNTNIELKYYKNDENGNPMISCWFINKSNFQIQTGHGTGLVETEYILSRQKFNELSDKDLKVIEKEIVNYIEKFGSKLQKQSLRKDRDYNLEHGINELTKKAQDTLLKVSAYFGEYFLHEIDEVEISINFKNNPFKNSNYERINFYYDLEHQAFNLTVETEQSLTPEYAIENSLNSREIINIIELIKNNKY